MTNLQNYTVCTVNSFTKNPYVPTVLRNHVYNLTTNKSLCGSVDLNNDAYDVLDDSGIVECKACAKAFDKIRAAAAKKGLSIRPFVEAETADVVEVEKTEQAEHIISELSQAAMTLRYVQATCDNDDEYADVLTVDQCNELDNMYERLQDMLQALGK